MEPSVTETRAPWPILPVAIGQPVAVEKVAGRGAGGAMEPSVALPDVVCAVVETMCDIVGKGAPR